MVGREDKKLFLIGKRRLRTIRFLDSTKQLYSGVNFLNLLRYYYFRFEKRKISKILVSIFNDHIDLKKLKIYCSPLHLVVSHSKLEVVELVLRKYVYIGGHCHYDGTLLHFAVLAGSLIIVSFLLKNGVDVNAEDCHGVTCLYNAALNGSTSISYLLIQYGAFINVVDKSGRTPLHIALKNRQLASALLLISNGANMSIRDNSGKTPTYLAARMGYLKIFEVLLGSEKPINSSEVRRVSFYSSPINYKNDLYLNKTCAINAFTNGGLTPLHIAVINGHEKIVDILLKNGANVNAETRKGESALYFAARKGYCSIVKIILNNFPGYYNNGNISALYAAARGLTVQHRNIVKDLYAYGFSLIRDNAFNIKLLYNSLIKGDNEIFEDLLQNGIDPLLIIDNLYDKDVRLIHYTAGLRRVEMTHLLIVYGSDVNLIDEEGRTPLHYASETNGFHVVKLLLRNQADVNAKDCYGRTPLHYASDTKRFNVVKLLLRNHAAVNAKDCYGRTSLHYAIEKQNSEIIKLLLHKKANINVKDRNGKTPLHIAAEEGYINMVKLLLEYKADVSVVDNNNKTPIYYSIVEGHTEVIEFLFDNGSIISFKDSDGKTPLHFAGSEKTAKLLLEYFDINAKDIYNRTPLFYSVKDFNSEVTKFLLENGAFVNARDRDGKTVLHLFMGIAYLYKEINILDILIEYGIDIDIMNNKGETAFELIKHFQPRVCKNLYEYVEEYILKLKVASMPFSLKHLQLFKWGREFSSKDEENIKLQYSEEIERMKYKRIGNSFITFYDILIKNINTLGNYLKDINILEVLKSEDYKIEFPVYATIITRRIRLGLRRRELIQQARLYLKYFTKLSFDCIEAIYSYLSNEDLKSFINAVMITDK